MRKHREAVAPCAVGGAEMQSQFTKRHKKQFGSALFTAGKHEQGQIWASRILDGHGDRKKIAWFILGHARP